ncbi:hypothetical protein Rs2_42338 [Raphanus sativus]|nr:hypothetical protein Rs2_42338 [Raphanus sativus]
MAARIKEPSLFRRNLGRLLFGTKVSFPVMQQLLGSLYLIGIQRSIISILGVLMWRLPVYSVVMTMSQGTISFLSAISRLKCDRSSVLVSTFSLFLIRGMRCCYGCLLSHKNVHLKLLCYRFGRQLSIVYGKNAMPDSTPVSRSRLRFWVVISTALSLTKPWRWSLSVTL